MPRNTASCACTDVAEPSFGESSGVYRLWYSWWQQLFWGSTATSFSRIWRAQRGDAEMNGTIFLSVAKGRLGDIQPVGGAMAASRSIRGTTTAIYAWGHGDFGRLGTATYCHSSHTSTKGTGSDKDAPTPTKIHALSGKHVKYVGLGGSHSIFVTDANEVYVCGHGKSGQ